MRTQEKKTLKRILLTFFTIVCVLLGGCRDKSVDHYNRGTDHLDSYCERSDNTSNSLKSTLPDPTRVIKLKMKRSVEDLAELSTTVQAWAVTGMKAGGFIGPVAAVIGLIMVFKSIGFRLTHPEANLGYALVFGIGYPVGLGVGYVVGYVAKYGAEYGGSFVINMLVKSRNHITKKVLADLVWAIKYTLVNKHTLYVIMILLLTVVEGLIILRIAEHI